MHHTLESPLPTIACQYYSQHFCSRGGCIQHIQAHHLANDLKPKLNEVNPPLPPSPMPGSLQLSSWPPSPIPSNNTPPSLLSYLPPLLGRHNNLGYIPSGFNSDHSTHTDEDTTLEFDVSNHKVLDTLPITCVYHPKLDGESILFKYALILTVITCRADLR